jgi:hypothetical protein
MLLRVRVGTICGTDQHERVAVLAVVQHEIAVAGRKIVDVDLGSDRLGVRRGGIALPPGRRSTLSSPPA